MVELWIPEQADFCRLPLAYIICIGGSPKFGKKMDTTYFHSRDIFQVFKNIYTKKIKLCLDVVPRKHADQRQNKWLCLIGKSITNYVPYAKIHFIPLTTSEKKDVNFQMNKIFLEGAFPSRWWASGYLQLFVSTLLAGRLIDCTCPLQHFQFQIYIYEMGRSQYALIHGIHIKMNKLFLKQQPIVIFTRQLHIRMMTNKEKYCIY